MSPLAVFALCVQACLIQSVMSCPSSYSCNNLGGYRLSPGLAPAAALGAGCGGYGGAGVGQVGVAGDVCASGSTAVVGSVPAMGSASFCGSLPACGSVSIAGQCGCGCGF